MKYRFLLALLVTTGVAIAKPETVTTPSLNNSRDKLSYAMGVMTGKTFKAHNINIDPRFFALGFDDAVHGNKTLLSDQQMQKIIQDFQKQSQSQAMDKLKMVAENNLQESEKFLQKNAKQSGVVTLASGLQYKILKAGDGPKPTANDTVTVNYEGKLINGNIFDSSYKRGQPASFAIKQVIQGWQEALVLMPVGSEWEVYLPPDLAYGDANVPNIGPNQALIFKISLISIKK